MEDLFAREQKIYDNYYKRLTEIKDGAEYEIQEFDCLVKEYGNLLRQLRRVIKISDKTAIDLNTSKLDLLDKVNIDILTGIYNRRFLDDNLKRIIKSLSRSGSYISIMMIDVDFFKKYNDTYGHSAGDECLKVVAKTLESSISRGEDFVVRYGGEEFLVVLPNTNEEGARILAKRMLNNIRRQKIPHINSDASKYVTISIGVTTSIASYSHCGTEYIKVADKALYISKRCGRDRYTFMNFEEDIK